MTKNKIALSFDIEDWYHNPNISGSVLANHSSLQDFYLNSRLDLDHITGPTIKLLDLLDSLKIIATFFIVSDVIERYPEIISRLKSSNHEIACHSLHHGLFFDQNTQMVIQNQKEWTDELIAAKSQLESAFSRKVIGYRAPSAYFTNWMIPVLQKLDFKYDSSIAYNKLYNKTNVRLRNIPSSPYFINDIDLGDTSPPSELVELPWSYYKLTEKIILPAGGAYFFRLFGNKYFTSAMKQNLSRGDTMFYIHPLDFSDKPVPYSNFRLRPFYWVNKGTSTFNMLKRFLDNFREYFVTCEEVYQRFIDTNNKKN